MGLFTGDCLFVGNAGRPDLLEKAAGKTGTKEAGARQQFASLNRRQPQPPEVLARLPANLAGAWGRERLWQRAGQRAEQHTRL